MSRPSRNTDSYDYSYNSSNSMGPSKPAAGDYEHTNGGDWCEDGRREGRGHWRWRGRGRGLGRGSLKQYQFQEQPPPSSPREGGRHHHTSRSADRYVNNSSSRSISSGNNSSLRGRQGNVDSSLRLKKEGSGRGNTDGKDNDNDNDNKDSRNNNHRNKNIGNDDKNDDNKKKSSSGANSGCVDDSSDFTRRSNHRSSSGGSAGAVMGHVDAVVEENIRSRNSGGSGDEGDGKRKRLNDRTKSRGEIGDNNRDQVSRDRIKSNHGGNGDGDGRGKRERSKIRDRGRSGAEPPRQRDWDRFSRGRRSRQEEEDEERLTDRDCLLQRKEAKIKELEKLRNERTVSMAAGEALAQKVERNRMEQAEIAIRVDSVKRLLALYDSRSSATATTTTASLSASIGTTTFPSSPHEKKSARSTADLAILPEPLSSQLQSSLLPSAPTLAVTPVPLEVSPPPLSSALSSLPQSLSANPTKSKSSSMRGEKGGASMLKGKVSSSLPGSASASFAAASDVGNYRRDRGGRSSGRSPTAVAESADSATHKAVSKKSRESSVVAVVSHSERGDRRSKHKSSSSSSRNSSEDEDNGKWGKDRTGGIGQNGKGLQEFITSMPPVARKPPASVDTDADFPAKVPSDGGRDRSRGRAGTEEETAVKTGAGGMTAAAVAVAVRGGGASFHRGVDVNAGSFKIKKQLMFKTTRSHKPRAMAFNPVVQGMFAVCSTDLSVDLWRYNSKNKELEKVFERNDVTPIGGAHMAWNPSGTHLAIGHTGATLVNNWAATIMSRQAGRGPMKLRSNKHTKPAQAVAWVTPSKNNQDHLVTGGDDGQVVIWTRALDVKSDLHKVAVLHSRHTSAVRSACCPSLSPTVISGGSDGRLVSYSIETASVQWEQLLRVSKSYHPLVNELLEFPDNPHAILVSAVDTARSHSMFTMDTRQNTLLIQTARRMSWKRKDEKHAYSSYIYPSISPCGRYVACAGDWNGCFHLWDVRYGRTEPMQSVVVNPLARVIHTAWHPDPDARALMSLSAASGQNGKHFALHLHGGLRS